MSPSLTSAVIPRGCPSGHRIRLRRSTWQFCEGSSPGVRGNLPVLLGDDAAPRSIPAQAGRIPTVISEDGACPGHSRRRGGVQSVTLGVRGLEGSSPAVRGPPTFRTTYEPRPRTIPGGSGACQRESSALESSALESSVLEGTGDHLRACGAYEEDAECDDDWDGPSPSVRSVHCP